MNPRIGSITKPGMMRAVDMDAWPCPHCGRESPRTTMAVFDPIATVRQAHPYAYCRPPLASGTPWAVLHHPADHFCGAPIAEGPTEAAAWLAAAERVCA